jgi:hypothetical protein
MCKNVYNHSRPAPALWDYLKGEYAVRSKLTLSLLALLLPLCFSTVALFAPARGTYHAEVSSHGVVMLLATQR